MPLRKSRDGPPDFVELCLAIMCFVLTIVIILFYFL